ncbi:mycofactocin-coupled SDR family oxidoreductase [Geodermatophilus sp. URMC 64]
MGKLENKVAFITGAARGIGRATAVRLAEEGADIIGVDILGPIPGATAPVSTPEDMAETVALVEKYGRRMVTATVDVTDEAALTRALADGVAELGRLDIAVANAGIGGPNVPVEDYPAQAFRDVVDVDLTGVFLTAKAAIPHIRRTGDGGALVLISSALGLRGNPNTVAYTAAKHGVVGLMKVLAQELAADRIRVNSVHPTNVDTTLIQNESAYKLFRPDLENPGRDDVAPAFQSLNLLPVPWVQPEDVAEAVLYLTADSGRYVTGGTHRVDAGWNTK